MQKIPKADFLAIYAVEQEASKFVDNILPGAKQRLSQAESELAAAKTNLAQVEGAIQGAQMMITGLVAKTGFTLEDYVNQRGEHVKALAAIEKGTKTADEIVTDKDESQTQTPAELVKDNPNEPEVVKPLPRGKQKRNKHRGQ